MLKHQRKGKRKEGKKGERKGKLLFHKLQSLSGGQTATLQAQIDLPKNPTQIRDAAAQVWETRNYFNYNYKNVREYPQKRPHLCVLNTLVTKHILGEPWLLTQVCCLNSQPLGVQHTTNFSLFGHFLFRPNRWHCSFLNDFYFDYGESWAVYGML